MPQIIIISYPRHHGHDTLETTVDQFSRSWDLVNSTPLSVVTFLSVTAIEGVVEVEKVKFGNGFVDTLTGEVTLGALVGASKKRANNLDGRVGFRDKRHSAVKKMMFRSSSFCSQVACTALHCTLRTDTSILSMQPQAIYICTCTDKATSRMLTVLYRVHKSLPKTILPESKLCIIYVYVQNLTLQPNCINSKRTNNQPTPHPHLNAMILPGGNSVNTTSCVFPLSPLVLRLQNWDSSSCICVLMSRTWDSSPLIVAGSLSNVSVSGERFTSLASSTTSLTRPAQEEVGTILIYCFLVKYSLILNCLFFQENTSYMLPGVHVTCTYMYVSLTRKWSKLFWLFSLKVECSEQKVGTV